MKIGMIIYGSNGDVEIFVSLALALVKKEHEVNLYIITINNRDYSFLNTYNGLSVHQKKFDSEIRNEPTTNVEFWNKPPESQYELLYKWYDTAVEDLIKYSTKTCLESDLVIGSQHILELSCLAEKSHIPYVSIRTFPGNIRTTYEPPYWATRTSDKSISELWDINDSYLNKYRKRHINRFRKKIDLPPIANVIQEVTNSKLLNLISFSNHLHDKKPDWPENTHLCGYFHTPDKYTNWDLPDSLSKFITSDSKKPVFISLGTMLEYENDIQAFHDLILKAARRIKRKVIFQSAWDHDNVVHDNVYKLTGFISYPKLLPYCDLVVHHAGVGTAHIVTESGCPSVVISYGFEQPFNASAFTKKGISSGSIHRAELNTDNLVSLINQALNDDTGMKKRAEDLGTLMKKEKGADYGVKLIEAAYDKLQISAIDQLTNTIKQ